jgi:tRNA nucleotidyltransferase (CCA-adding enzyme)
MTARDLGITLDPPATVLRIAERLERAGFETWCVGGAVRDALLGHQHSDWDLATAARPEEVMNLFRRTVPVGVAHGTVGVLDRNNALHEVTTFRRDVRTDGRHAVVEFGASLDEDLARRDLTINAIAYSASRRLLRAVGRAEDRMREDRLRALRAMRFAARFEFEIDPETWNAIVGSSHDLDRLSAERIKEELSKIMNQVPRPSRAISLWRASGALAALVPILADLDPVTIASVDFLSPPQAAGGRGAVGSARADARRLARLASLFIGHSGDESARSLRALRFSKQETEWIAGLAAAWADVGANIERTLLNDVTPADVDVRRWVAAAGRERIASLLRIGSARWCALRVQGAAAPKRKQISALYSRMRRSAYHDALGLGDLAVDGDDLVDLGIARGREIGDILKRLLLAVIADPSLNNRNDLLALAKRFSVGQE